MKSGSFEKASNEQSENRFSTDAEYLNNVGEIDGEEVLVKVCPLNNLSSVPYAFHDL